MGLGAPAPTINELKWNHSEWMQERSWSFSRSVVSRISLNVAQPLSNSVCVRHVGLNDSRCEASTKPMTRLAKEDQRSPFVSGCRLALGPPAPIRRPRTLSLARGNPCKPATRTLDPNAFAQESTLNTHPPLSFDAQPSAHLCATPTAAFGLFYHEF